jgi:predicted aminopeptidase
VDETHDAKCPNCGGEMANLGRDLRLPAKTKNEQWQCIKYLIDNKYNIYSCGCQGIGFVPHKMADAIALVAERKEIQKAIQKQYDTERKLEERRKARRKRDQDREIKKQLKE